MKIKVTIGEHSIDFQKDGSEEFASVKYSDHPGVFDHPRHYISQPDEAARIFNPVLKRFSRMFSLPHVFYRIEKRMDGGITDVDLRAINESFIWAGARKAKYEELV